MKNTAVAFFTSTNGEKLEEAINKFFNNHTFMLINACYGCCYEIGKGKTVHNALVTYQFITPAKGQVVVDNASQVSTNLPD